MGHVVTLSYDQNQEKFEMQTATSSRSRRRADNAGLFDFVGSVKAASAYAPTICPRPQSRLMQRSALCYLATPDTLCCLLPAAFHPKGQEELAIGYGRICCGRLSEPTYVLLSPSLPVHWCSWHFQRDGQSEKACQVAAPVPHEELRNLRYVEN